MANIIPRNGRFSLQGTWEGKQRQVALKTDNLTTAKSRARVFETIAEAHGFEAAVINLEGGRFLRKGEDPTLEEMGALYREFVASSDSPPREITIKANLRNLKRVLDASKETTISRINAEKVRKELLPNNATPSQRRTYTSIIRSVKGIFKKRALAYYHGKGIKLSDPFESVDLVAPKVTAYTPLSSDVRMDIWNNADKELSAPLVCMVLLALGAGMRRAEIQACRDSWFSVQKDIVYISIQEEEGFSPKSGEKRVVPISLELWERLKTMRGEKPQKFFVKREGETLWVEFGKVSKWLHKKGVNDSKPLHALRKEAGSLMAKNGGILEASRFLGHADTVITSKHYVGVENMAPVQINDNAPLSPLEAVAAEYGLDPELVKTTLQKLAKKARKPS